MSSAQTPQPPPQPLAIEQVRHIADLCRLRLAEPQLVAFQAQLSSVLQHVAKLSELDVADVEPLAHPGDITNRMAEDSPSACMSQQDLLRNAPAAEGPFLVVPKVLAGGEA